MIVGFTGTRAGMSLVQMRFLEEILIDLKVTQLHHGCCVGADSQANRMAQSLGIKTVGHPPLNTTLMADCKVDYLHEPQHYLKRNHDIVDETALLLVAPLERTEKHRSGTWATYRYANKTGKSLIVLARGTLCPKE